MAAARFASNMTTEMIEIVVSEDDTSKTYYIHKSLLCDKSTYFKKCLASGMLEANNNKVILEDVKIEAFEVIVHWLYRRGYDKIPDEELPFYWVYNIADRLCMEQLKNAVVNRLMEVWDTKKLTAANLVTAMADLDPDTMLGNFLLDQLAHHYADSYTDGHADLANPDHAVLLKVTSAWAEASKRRRGLSESARKNFDPSKNAWCAYHEHNDTPWCLDSQPTEAHLVNDIMREPISTGAWKMFQKMNEYEKEDGEILGCTNERRAEELISKGYIEENLDVSDGDSCEETWMITVYNDQEDYDDWKKAQKNLTEMAST